MTLNKIHESHRIMRSATFFWARHNKIDAGSLFSTEKRLTALKQTKWVCGLSLLFAYLFWIPTSWWNYPLVLFMFQRFLLIFSGLTTLVVLKESTQVDPGDHAATVQAKKDLGALYTKCSKEAYRYDKIGDADEAFRALVQDSLVHHARNALFCENNFHRDDRGVADRSRSGMDSVRHRARFDEDYEMYQNFGVVEAKEQYYNLAKQKLEEEQRKVA